MANTIRPKKTRDSTQAFKKICISWAYLCLKLKNTFGEKESCSRGFIMHPWFCSTRCVQYNTLDYFRCSLPLLQIGDISIYYGPLWSVAVCSSTSLSLQDHRNTLRWLVVGINGEAAFCLGQLQRNFLVTLPKATALRYFRHNLMYASLR